MKKLLAIALSTYLLVGCQATRDFISPPGEMGKNGKVNKCHDWVSNQQACGEAIYNAPRVAKLNLGQSIGQVREIMGREPDHRSIKEDGGQAVEEWHYLTNYKESVYSVITFKSSKLVSIQAKIM